MAKNIEPKLKKIGEYLTLDEGALFIIPEYQRAYSWGTDHCDKLWQDINEYVESDSKDRYFFGTIIINCQDSDTKFALIDGQQRMTTLSILCRAIYDSVSDEKLNRLDAERNLLYERHPWLLMDGDPYYNPNLAEDFLDYRVNVIPDFEKRDYFSKAHSVRPSGFLPCGFHGLVEVDYFHNRAFHRQTAHW